MFNWFKKKDPDAALRESLAASLEKYDPDEDNTASTFTDIDFGNGPVRVKKVNYAIQPDMDPWAVNPGDTTQWCKEEKKR